MGLTLKSFSFRVYTSEFQVQTSPSVAGAQPEVGVRVWGQVVRVEALGCIVEGLGFRSSRSLAGTKPAVGVKVRGGVLRLQGV